MDGGQDGGAAAWSVASDDNKNRAASRSHSPHLTPPPPLNAPSSFVDPSLTSSSGDSNNPYLAAAAASSNSNLTAAGPDEHLSFSTPYLSSAAAASGHDPMLSVQQPQPQFHSNNNSLEGSFINQPRPPPGYGDNDDDDFSGLLNSDMAMYPPSSNPNQNPHPGFLPSLTVDPHFDPRQGAGPAAAASVNPADLSRMSSPHNPSPPNLAPPTDPHSSPGGQVSPVSSPGAYYTPQHSRHTSLDPMAAAYMSQQQQQQTDWQGLLGNPSFQGHRRAPSEHSDVSSVSHHSPYFAHNESFDASEGAPSPLLPSQNDPAIHDNSFGIESFSLSDPIQRQQHPPHHQQFSPAHSPYNVSPQLAPQMHPQPSELPGDNSFHLAQHPQYDGSQVGLPPAGSDQYLPKLETSPQPSIHSHNSPSDMGQAAQMAPPSINVEFAPPARASHFEPAPEGGYDTLSPPSRSRGRSKSDPFGHPITRPTSTASETTLVTAPSHDPQQSLAPFTPSSGSLSTPASRDTSPSAKNRRQSTSSIDNRNYILDLADPQRSGATPADAKRLQKHPATFQCNLCPKRFTRAYNLRSHLRTHTDERPFVCTVCGKAFARQHDRKRHEGLHSGEKKFVCRGDLSRGGQWGCGRRFARADALGRHFRSEAGRVCIKPLLDEESLDRDPNNAAAYLAAQAGQQQQEQLPGGHLQPMPQPLTVPSSGGFTLPAAILAQYPALQNLPWDQIASQPAPEDNVSDFGGGSGNGGGGTARSSFDASSGGEFGFGEDDESSPMSNNNGFQPQHPQDRGPQLMGMNSGGAGGGGVWPPPQPGQPGHSWPSEYDGR